jgi:hypothetical protein
MYRGELERLIDKAREAVKQGFFSCVPSLLPLPRLPHFLRPMDSRYNGGEEKSHLGWLYKLARQIVMITEWKLSSNGYGFMHNVC